MLFRSRKLLELGMAQAELDAIRQTINGEVADSVDFADKSPLPPAEELYTDNYTQENYPYIMD